MEPDKAGEIALHVDAILIPQRQYPWANPSPMQRQLCALVRLGSDCREHYERSVAASFDPNRYVSLADSHVEPSPKTRRRYAALSGWPTSPGVTAVIRKPPSRFKAESTVEVGLS